MYQFKKRNAKNLSVADYSGNYVFDESKGEINHKPVYVNLEKKMFLASHPSDTGWHICSLHYWDNIYSKQGYFGSLCHGVSKDPVSNEGDGVWNNYEIKGFTGFLFKVKSGGNDYADCSGLYVSDESKGLFNLNPVFLNASKKRILLSHQTKGWSITGLQYWDDIKKDPSNFGGFHTIQEASPHKGIWEQYNVEVIDCSNIFDLSDNVEDESFWHKHESSTVSYKAVCHFGPTRTAADFKLARKKCVLLDCGGFAWRKPQYNQFGEEDTPPACFYFRKTQSDLHKNLKKSDKFDFFIASEKYSPDCSFKEGRDPAPSCHIRWQPGKGVQAFACQVQVSDPTQYTYYATCGFHCGYCGIQQHSDTKQQLLFSVWNHPDANEKVSNSSVCEGIIAKSFGGEGMGMQAIAIYDSKNAENSSQLASWIPGEKYTFVVETFKRESGSEYVCSFHKPGLGWNRIASHFRPEPTKCKKGKLSGLYSFIEDFQGNSHRRSATYSAWVKDDVKSTWRPISSISSTSTHDLDYPNKCVETCKDCSDCDQIKMTTGGGQLDNCGLYCGPLSSPPPVPDCLLKF